MKNKLIIGIRIIGIYYMALGFVPFLYSTYLAFSVHYGLQNPLSIEQFLSPGLILILLGFCLLFLKDWARIIIVFGSTLMFLVVFILAIFNLIKYNLSFFNTYFLKELLMYFIFLIAPVVYLTRVDVKDIFKNKKI